MSSKRLGYARLYEHLDKILVLFFTIFLFLDFVWGPLSSWLAAVLLKGTGYQFLSYNNVLAILTGTPLIFVGMIFLFLVNLFVAYFQIIFLFRGLHLLFGDETLGIRDFYRRSWKDTLLTFKEFTLSKIAFVSFYLIVLFPLIREVLNIYYLNKIKVPVFIMDFITKNSFVLFGVVGFVILVYYFSIRWLFALPQIIFERKTVREALSYSMIKTRHRWWSYFWRIMWIIIKSMILYLFPVGIILLLQKISDSQSQMVTFLAGVINYSLIQLSYYMMVTYFLLKLMSLMTESLPQIPSTKQRPILRICIIAIAFLLFMVEGVLFLIVPLRTKPLVISHRGVSQDNGVQNTIESLEATSKLKPDFIEIDIQETKDGQFVLMHDSDLQSLADVDATPQELTLKELTRLEVSENGYTSTIPSFDAYLEKADSLGQKLLIEVKTSSQDSDNMMKNFLARYGRYIKEKGHEIQSLDYKVVDATVNNNLKIPVYFILPYNTIFPQTKANGYTMEYSTLDENFTSRLSHTNKKVYDWTVNDDDAIKTSFNLDVDGLITDDVPLVKQAIKERYDNPDFFELLLDKSIDNLKVFTS